MPNFRIRGPDACRDLGRGPFYTGCVRLVWCQLSILHYKLASTESGHPALI